MSTQFFVNSKKIFLFLSTLIMIFLLLPGCNSSEEPDVSSKGESIKKFGMILVGPKDDKGWSQAHFEGGQQIVSSTGAEMIVADLINPADSPNTTVEQVANDMISQGAELIFATSDDMKDGILAAAKVNPDIPMIWSSGDSAWADGKDYKSTLTNLGNIMGQMEFGKYMAGCAAASESKSGNIGFLGPLINDETRRLVNAAYIGARDCWTDKGNDVTSLNFEVTWIGFWFHIPGVTLDPTTVVNDFFDTGVDVVISHIDTPEALIVTDQRVAAGKDVLVVGYDYEDSCEQAPAACLGVPYFNWGPSYVKIAESVDTGSYSSKFDWLEPTIKDGKTSADSIIGFKYGNAISDESKERIESMVENLSGDVKNIFSGPLKFQDGKEYVAEGKTASLSNIWYTPQLIEGIIGDSGK